MVIRLQIRKKLLRICSLPHMHATHNNCRPFSIVGSIALQRIVKKLLFVNRCAQRSLPFTSIWVVIPLVTTLLSGKIFVLINRKLMSNFKDPFIIGSWWHFCCPDDDLCNDAFLITFFFGKKQIQCCFFGLIQLQTMNFKRIEFRIWSQCIDWLKKKIE